MKKLLFIVALAITACNNLPEDKSGKFQMSNDDDMLEYGKLLFEKYCVACHGEAGDGNVSEKANLTMSKLDETETGDLVYHGRGLMPMFSDKLGEPEIQAVSKYVLSLHKK